MKSIAKQSTNKHYSSLQRTTAEYMFVVNLEFFMFVFHDSYCLCPIKDTLDGGIQSPLLAFKCLQKKNLWLDLFFHFCFRRTVVKFFENRLLHWVNVTKTKKKFSYREFVTVLYLLFYVRPKHTVVSCSNSIPLMQDMLGIRWPVKIEIDLYSLYVMPDEMYDLCFALHRERQLGIENHVVFSKWRHNNDVCDNRLFAIMMLMKLFFIFLVLFSDLVSVLSERK